MSWWWLAPLSAGAPGSPTGPLIAGGHKHTTPTLISGAGPGQANSYNCKWLSLVQLLSLCFRRGTLMSLSSTLSFVLGSIFIFLSRFFRTKSHSHKTFIILIFLIFFWSVGGKQEIPTKYNYNYIYIYTYRNKYRDISMRRAGRFVQWCFFILKQLSLKIKRMD